MNSPALPYIHAVMSEAHRVGALTPLMIPHKTTVDTSTGGEGK